MRDIDTGATSTYRRAAYEKRAKVITPRIALNPRSERSQGSSRFTQRGRSH